MPSYKTPSTNLSTGLSTKPVRLTPDYLAKSQNFVPLSVFFVGVPEEETDPDSLFGYRMPDRKKKVAPKEKKAKGGTSQSKDDKESSKDDDSKDKDKDDKEKKDSSQSVQSTPARTQQAPAQSQGAQEPAQSQSAKQESKGSMSEGLSVLLDMAIRNQAFSRSEMTTTVNVPTFPIPIGAGDGRKFLDYGDGHPLKKKKKKRSLSRKLYLLLRQ